MKSIPIESHGFVSIGNGCNLRFDPLDCWQSSHVLQNIWVSLTMDGHQYHRRTYSHVLSSPKCPSILCALSSICVMILRSLGIHITSLLWTFFVHKVLSFISKNGCFAVSSFMRLNSLSFLYPFFISRSSQAFSLEFFLCNALALPFRFRSISSRVISTPWSLLCG